MTTQELIDDLAGHDFLHVPADWEKIVDALIATLEKVKWIEEHFGLGVDAGADEWARRTRAGCNDRVLDVLKDDSGDAAEGNGK